MLILFVLSTVRNHAYGADAILTAGQQQRHAVALVYLPALLGNAEKPTFRYKTVEKGEQHRVMVSLGTQRQREAYGLRPVRSKEVGVICERKTRFVFSQPPGEAVIQIHKSTFQGR